MHMILSGTTRFFEQPVVDLFGVTACKLFRVFQLYELYVCWIYCMVFFSATRNWFSSTLPDRVMTLRDRECFALTQSW